MSKTKTKTTVAEVTVEVQKPKRKYTKTPRWTVNDETTTGLIDALKKANALLRDNVTDTVTISRIKRDA